MTSDAEGKQPHMDDLAFLSATSLAGMIRDGALTSADLTDHYIRRIDAFDGRTNAVVVRIFDRAREAAAAADARQRSGAELGPLHGVPMTIKESFALAGTPTTFGFAAFADNIASSNAVAVDRLVGAGAVILGKTNVPPGLMDGQSVNPVYGRTANPWDLERTPGGSSGGSAAAVAAGLSALEFGSDIASSIRNPAHYCGIFGHKPSYGLCPTRGHSLFADDLSPDIAVTGPLARSAADLALAFSVVAGADEPTSRGWSLALRPSRKAELRQFAIGLVTDDPFAEVDNDVAVLLERLGTFLETQDVTVRRDHRPGFDSRELYQLYMVLLRAAGSASASDEEVAAAAPLAAGASRFSREVATLNAYGVVLSHRDWLRLDAERARVRREWRDYFEQTDLLLCPPLSTAAFPHDERPPQQRTLAVNGREVPFENQLFWAGYAGVAYLPATVAPIGLTDGGLPVGVQIIGPEYGDYECLRFAQLLEEHYRAFTPPPAFAGLVP
jgi:amidase